MFQKKFVFALFFTILFLLSHQNIFACSYGTRPTVLEALEWSKMVIIAKAVSVQKAKPEETGYYENIKSTKWIVEKVYKGDVKVGDEIIIGQGNDSNCSIAFKKEIVGNQYVFYINDRFVETDENGRPVYYIHFCGKTASVEYAANDLFFLDNLDKLLGKTRISGEISCFSENCPSPSNIEITFTGENKTFSTKTDKKGFYQIYDLPAGTYLIEAKLPRGWKAEEDEYYLMLNNGYVTRYEQKELKKPLKNQFYIGLGNKSHVEFDFFAVPDNSIRGKVFSPVGKPMQDVCVSAVAPDSAEKKYTVPNCTNENGDFVIEKIYPGNYFLVVNSGGKMNSNEPFGEVYYPGVTDKKSAGLISIEPGKFLGDINIQIPKMAELVEISGRFLYSDGTPVADEKVSFKPSEKNEDIDGEARTKTDAQGRFSIKILKGLRGTLSAELLVSVNSNKYENCPEALKVMEELGERLTNVKTNEVEISGNENMSDVKLVLPFPGCERKKD